MGIDEYLLKPPRHLSRGVIEGRREFIPTLCGGVYPEPKGGAEKARKIRRIPESEIVPALLAEIEKM